MNDQDTIRQCLKQIKPAALEYDEWLAVGMACKDAGIPFHEWDEWSKQDTRYKPAEMASKWNSFRNSGTSSVGIGSIVKLCRDQGGTVEYEQDQGHELTWDCAIGPKKTQEMQVVRREWLMDAELPPKPNGNWNGKADLTAYLRTLFSADDRVGLVTSSWEQQNPDGTMRYMPERGSWDRTAGELLQQLSKTDDIGMVIGDWNPEVGAWVRFNPLDGQGCSDTNVTEFRYALVESDDISLERQYAIYQQLELPIAALVHSGGKSLHAIVRIEAPDFKEYQKRVDFLYDVCKKNGLVIDRKNRNPSRLSRLPGVNRGKEKQWLVATCIGKGSWGEWADWIAAVNDDLPEVEALSDFIMTPPPLPDQLIAGLLRNGHKMLLAGPSKAGKSFLLLQLAVAIAEGRQWLGWQCQQGRVLYVNLELERASVYHRLAEIYQLLNIQRPGNSNKIDVWNLRGKAMGMDHLAPKLIRRAIKQKYAAVIIDPIYKVITGDENAADQMAKFCNQFDKVCFELGAAVIYCHHHSKGDQGQKNASDRASGSGVFARDPDAMLDMIELQIDDHRRQQLSNRWECDAMVEAFRKAMPNFAEVCPQDDAIVADKLARWAEANGLGDIMRAARQPAVAAAQKASGWRLEGICREFAAPDERRFWFRWPIHVKDEHTLLIDAKASGEERLNRTKSIENEHQIIDSEMALTFEELSKTDDEVTVKAMAEALQRDEDTIRDRIKKGAKRGAELRYKNGKIFKKPNTRTND